MGFKWNKQDRQKLIRKNPLPNRQQKEKNVF